jgi:hypothetical protein
MKENDTKMRLQQEDLEMDYFRVLKDKYPLGMQVFLDWIDEYKKAINWKSLFNAGHSTQPGLSNSKQTVAPKYHELPGAMQVGIFIEFMKQRGGCEYEVDLFVYSLREEFENMAKMLQLECELDEPVVEKAKVVVLPENRKFGENTSIVGGLLSSQG